MRKTNLNYLKDYQHTRNFISLYLIYHMVYICFKLKHAGYRNKPLLTCLVVLLDFVKYTSTISHNLVPKLRNDV